MKIIVDAMGGDLAPDEIVKGAIMAAEEFDVKIILTGRGEDILKSLDKMGKKELPKGIEIANATEVITMEDDPATAVRKKKDSSMAVGLNMLRDGLADAMVSAGNTGALLSGATLVVKRVRGIRRAAMAPYLPNSGHGFLLLDCGANVECAAEYLLQFAYMGSYYAKKVRKIENPRVGLLNIGSEETKGTQLQLEAYKLLSQASEEGRVNFVGNVESRDAIQGACDVLVCDGFTGNVLLKGVEGLGILIISELKKAFTKNFISKLAALILKKNLKEFKNKLDVSEVGGTALLGISKCVVKAHGSSKAYDIRSAVLQAINTVSSGVIEDITNNIAYMRIGSEEE